MSYISSFQFISLPAAYGCYSRNLLAHFFLCKMEMKTAMKIKAKTHLPNDFRNRDRDEGNSKTHLPKDYSFMAKSRIYVQSTSTLKGLVREWEFSPSSFFDGISELLTMSGTIFFRDTDIFPRPKSSSIRTI